MTRILHILDHSLPLHSGYSFRTRALMTAQRNAGHDCRAITGLRHTGPSLSPSAAEAEWHDGLPFYRTQGRANGPRLYREWREISLLADAIVRLASQWRPDVLHAHSPALCGMAAVIAGRRLQLPVVYEIRAFWEDAARANGSIGPRSPVYALTRALENKVVAAVDGVMTICHGLRDDLIGRGVPAGKIGVMPNGVDLTLFSPPHQTTGFAPDETGDGKTDSAARQPAANEAPVIGFIGSFYDYEGLDVLIDAMPQVLREFPKAQLHLIGSGPQTDAIRRAALGSPAAQAIHMPGSVPHTEVADRYARCTVMAYPRKASRLTELVTPLKPLEAMAQGVLVAASAIGGHRELIEHGVTGSLFAPDNPAACAEALIRLLRSPASWPEMRAHALNRIRERHDWAQNAARYTALYTALQRGKLPPCTPAPPRLPAEVTAN